MRVVIPIAGLWHSKFSALMNLVLKGVTMLRRSALYLLLPVSAALMMGCGSTPQASLPSSGQNQSSQNTTNVEGIISPSVQGEARQKLVSFLKSLPDTGDKIDRVILVDVDSGLLSQGLSQTPSVVASDTADASKYIEPFTKKVQREDNGPEMGQLNLGLCGDASTNKTGFYSRRSAEQQYAGFKASLVLPSSFTKASASDSLYMYGSIYDRLGSQGVEIGLVWKPSASKWVAYMSLNGYYPNASSTATTYDAKGVLLPVIQYDTGATAIYKMTDFRDASNTNIFYVSANFDGTVVAYRYSSSNDTTGVTPPTNLNPSSGYSRIGVRAITSIANGGQATTGSYMFGGQYANMQLITGVSNGTTTGTTTIDWTPTQTTENCVNNTTKVNASNPLSTKIYTNIDLR
ncbi:hypothetical protein [Deinococcus sp. DB0503]|uniref:hypothetical protein n=1 Tax=Deinococcus sp. DB0503 TaxID=2479203 RepID=UPI0018DF1114|nr:hypothetical protein [Deinococcus sp. DB0503]